MTIKFYARIIPYIYNYINFTSRPNGEIIDMIRNGEHTDIGAEKLRGLLKLLPETDEIEMLKNFDGDKLKLANAEKFLLMLMDVPQ